jgi:GGDEF domain-containing protein
MIGNSFKNLIASNNTKIGNSLLLDLNLQPGVAIFLVVLFVVLSLVAIYFLIRGIRRDRNRTLADKFKIKKLDRDSFNEMIKRKYTMADESTHFLVIFLSIEGAEDLKTSLGERQYAHTLETLSERLIRVIPHGSKLCEYGDGILAVFIEEEMDNISTTNICTMCITECNKPITLLAHAKFVVNINIGVADNNQFSPSAEQLLINVGIALENAKRSGLNKFTIYSEQLAERQTDEYKQYQQIKTAIAQNQFSTLITTELSVMKRLSGGYIRLWVC